MGLLVVKGWLRVDQFWPRGGSDADTATLEVLIDNQKAFVFVGDDGQRTTTRVFFNAEVIGRQGPQAVVKFDKKLDSHKINVRLQGLDAPELHFQPTVKGSKGKNGKFRQDLGETCAHALWRYLSSLGQKRIPCEVVSRVRRPGDVCDVYGRVVGNVVLGEDGTRVDVNHWIVREGWALPGIYNSMTKNEIRQLLVDHQDAVAQKRGLFKSRYVSRSLDDFEKDQKYRTGPEMFRPYSDHGKINFPKFFRRQADHHVRRLVDASVTPKSFLSYVGSKKDDIAIETGKFLAHKESPSADVKKQFKQLATFVSAGGYPTGKELVFWEAEAKLVKSGTKKAITAW
jgi:endonuclease YncB( thermonuclease family)